MELELQGKNPLSQRLRGGSNPWRCITQDSEPNTLLTELFLPQHQVFKDSRDERWLHWSTLLAAGDVRLPAVVKGRQGHLLTGDSHIDASYLLTAHTNSLPLKLLSVTRASSYPLYNVGFTLTHQSTQPQHLSWHVVTDYRAQTNRSKCLGYSYESQDRSLEISLSIIY